MTTSNAQLNEPSYCEIFTTWLVFHIPGNGAYRSFADSLPLTGGEAVLDLGCGMGTVAYYAAKRLPQGKLTCVDISKKWLAVCRNTLRRYTNVSFLHGSIDCLPLPDGSFDLIYCHFVLHGIPNGELSRIVPALARLLKANGKLVFREPLENTAKIRFIHSLTERSELHKESGRITDIPLMGNALENVYRKMERRCQSPASSGGFQDK